MREVAILGAGALGGAVAQMLARLDLVPAIRLVDESPGVAQGKALDIAQSAGLEGFSTIVTGGTDMAAAGSASIVVLADCATRGEWKGDEALALLRRLPTGRSRAILCAGADQRDVVERGVREEGLRRGLLFGSAPEALAAAIRAAIAGATNSSARDVALTVLGIPPDRIVVPWEEATIGGVAATRLLDGPARRALVQRVPKLWPPGPYALGAAAAKAIEAMAGRSRAIVACFVAPDDSMGRKVRTSAVPVHLDAGGVVDAQLPELTAHDRIALDNAVML
jgi:malate dehydrogenase